MAKFLTPRNLAIGGGLGAAVLLFPRTRQTVNPVGEQNSNVFETPGVKNIGERYATQGGTETHMPGVATPRGSTEKQTSPQDTMNGTTSGKFKDRIADQKQDPNIVGKSLNQATLGVEKGK